MHDDDDDDDPVHTLQSVKGLSPRSLSGTLERFALGCSMTRALFFEKTNKRDCLVCSPRFLTLGGIFGFRSRVSDMNIYVDARVS